MTPSKKEVKKSSKKILETNIALKIKEALKDIGNIDTKKITETIRDASKKIAKSVIKASKEVEKEAGTPPTMTTATRPKTVPKISKVKATKVVARVKEITGTGDMKNERSIIKAAVLPAIPASKKVAGKITEKAVSTSKKSNTPSSVLSEKTTSSKKVNPKNIKPTEGGTKS